MVTASGKRLPAMHKVFRGRKRPLGQKLAHGRDLYSGARPVVVVDGPLEKTPRRSLAALGAQQEVDGMAGLFHGPIRTPSGAREMPRSAIISSRWRKLSG